MRIEVRLGDTTYTGVVTSVTQSTELRGYIDTEVNIQFPLGEATFHVTSDIADQLLSEVYNTGYMNYQRTEENKTTINWRRRMENDIDV